MSRVQGNHEKLTFFLQGNWDDTLLVYPAVYFGLGAFGAWCILLCFFKSQKSGNVLFMTWNSRLAKSLAFICVSADVILVPAAFE